MASHLAGTVRFVKANFIKTRFIEIFYQKAASRVIFYVIYEQSMKPKKMPFSSRKLIGAFLTYILLSLQRTKNIKE